jgi:hypothetical protein
MRIESGVTTRYIYFVAVDSTDYASRETGLSSFTVYRSRDGAAAAAMTTPTINETDATNMPGVYELLLDEDMTIGSGNDSEEMVFHITATGMAPVTRTIELYRPKITAGNTLDVTTTGAAGIDWGNVENQSTSVDLSATATNLVDTCTTNTDMRGTDSALLASSAPTNFADLAITVTTGQVTVGTNNDKTGYSISGTKTTLDALNDIAATDVVSAGAITTLSGAVVNVDTVDTCTTNTDMRGTDSAFLAASAPTNFSSLSISAGGIVDSNVEEIDAVAQAATNLEILFDSNEGFYSAYAGPRGPGIYLNDAAGNTNTTNGVDGTIGNPVSTIAAAKTLADSMSLDRIYIFNDTAVTLAATMEDYEFVGLGEATNNSVALASQDVDQSAFYNLTITGVQAGTTRAYYEKCIFGAATVNCVARWCGLSGTLTMSDNDNNILEHCFSMVAGNGTPVLNGASGANLDVSVRHYSGGLEFQNMSATSTASYESDGQVVVNANCNASFALTVRGNCSITDNASLSSLTQDAVYNAVNVKAQVVDAIDTDTYAEPGQGAPGATISLSDKISYLYKAWRNKTEQTSSTLSLYDDAGTTVDQKATVADNGTTASRSEIVTGP